MIDNALKYNLGFCFRRKDAKGVNARELCFSGRHQNVATERTAEYGSLIGLQIPLPYLKTTWQTQFGWALHMFLILGEVKPPVG